MDRRCKILGDTSNVEVYYLDGLGFEVQLIRPSEALEAMDINAKNFLDWIYDKGYHPGLMKGTWVTSTEKYSTQQLYDLFIKSNNNGE